MTEGEAKTKWCPMTRTVFGYEQGTTQPFNRFITDDDDPERDAIVKQINAGTATRCVGSRCMMWVEDYQHDGYDVDGELKPPICHGGHCGLVR